MKEIFKLLLKGGVPNVVSLLSIPIIALNYTPLEFSVYSGLILLATFFSMLTSLRIENLLITRKNIRFILNYLINVSFLSIFVCFPLVFVYYFISSDFSSTLFIFLLVLYSFFTVIYNIVSSWFVRLGEINRVVNINILRSISFALLAIFFSDFNYGLIYSGVLSQSIILFNLFSIYDQYELSFRSFKIKFIFLCAKKTISIFFSHILSLINQRGLFIISAISFGASFSGIIAMALKVINVPSTVLSVTIGNKFRYDLSKEVRDCNKEKVVKVFNRYSIFLSLASLLFTCVFLFFPFHLLDTYVKKEWLETIPVIKLMSLIVLAQCFYFPMSGVFFILECQKYDVNWHLVNSVIVSSIFFMSMFIENFDYIVLIYSCLFFASSLAVYFKARKIVNLKY